MSRGKRGNQLQLFHHLLDFQIGTHPTHAIQQTFCTQKLLHTDLFTHRGFYIDAFTHRRFYTQKLLHTEPFAHRSFYTHTFLDTVAFTQELSHADPEGHFGHKTTPGADRGF